MTSLQIEPSSFRDPSGFVFYRNNKILRQVNVSYRTDYDLLMKSGLYKNLTDSGLLIPHSTSSEAPYKSESCSLVIEPQKIPYISYPYEWCFSELKDAALLTLKIQQTALQYGMSLKDASAYNIQFLNGKPVFIDTLSFEKYKEGSPWIAYRQFCEQFLAQLNKGLKPSTAGAYYARFKTIIRALVKASIIPQDPAADIHVRHVDSLPKYLTLEEVHELMKQPCGNDDVREAFLFSCNTGMRYQDVNSLVWKQIRGETIEFVQLKTGRAA